jgi:regulator of nonsense transcripts 2
MLLEDGKKKKVDTDEQVGKKIEPAETADASTASVKEDDQSTAIANKTVGAQVDALLARLPDLTSKDLIDQAAIDFCFLNSKASRNRLVKAVQEIPKGRSDLLPSYSRLVATLGRYMPDVTKGLVDYLDQEFRSLQRRKEKEFLGQARLGNIRYLAELTKFGVVPEHVIFHCLKVSLDDFSRMNIEIICNLLENCGRYLLRNPETSPRMVSFLETLKRKKSVQHIGQQERMLIENAVYYVDPPVRAAIQQKERTPMDLFIRKLVYLDMNNRNYTRILKQIRRLHWEEPEVSHFRILRPVSNLVRLLLYWRRSSQSPAKSSLAISIFLQSSQARCIDITKTLSPPSSTISWNTLCLAWSRTTSNSINAESQRLSTLVNSITIVWLITRSSSMQCIES